MPHVILLDVGTGNLRSVHKALQSLGAEITLTDSPSFVPGADKIILPGVGAFGDFMGGLRDRGLEQPVKAYAASGRPLLGICVGMQAFFDESGELGRHSGLGLLPGKVSKFPDIAPLKVPHTGWNVLESAFESPLLRGLGREPYAYFNHSFYCSPQDERVTAASTDYGIRFTSVVQKDNLYGVQFHPEKSQKVGLKILENFLRV
jgi:glutamine amidotransferase